LYKWILTVGLAVMGWGTSAIASDDARFTVTIPLPSHSSWKEKVDDGMDLLLDRLLPQLERQQNRLQGKRYLVRATPSKEMVRFRFRAATVIAALQRRGLHPIVDEPHIVLQLSMHDATGAPMPQTVALLRKEAVAIASQWGIQLSTHESQPSITVGLAWRWIDDHWLSLVVDSDNASLAALGGENKIDTEEPMVQLHDRLYRILLRARDEAAALNQQPIDSYTSAFIPTNHTITISIMHSAPLSEQVGLEQVLQAVLQVKHLIPLMLNHHWQQYQLQVTDEQWITSWFANRGMQASKSATGWEVR